MGTDVKSMFDEIIFSLNDEKKSSSRFQDILRLKVGNNYLVRLIPNITNAKATFYHYHHHGWTSLATGQYVDAICPSTWGDTCPICTERFKLYKKGDDNDKILARYIRRLDKHLVNVYVIDDPTDEENNGIVKILRFGVRIKDKFDAAITGDDSEEFGSKVFDLTENGCNFKIKVETNQEGKTQFTNYGNSRFTNSMAIPGMTPEKIKEVYEQCFVLEDQVSRVTTEALKQMLNVHLYDREDSSNTSRPKKTVEQVVKETGNDKTEVKTEAKPEAGPDPKLEETQHDDTDDKIKDLLEGLEGLE